MDIHQDTSTSSPVHQQLSPSSPLDAASASASAPPRATTKNSETKQNKNYTHHCVHVHNDGHPLVPSSFLPVDLPPPPLPFWSRVRHEVSIIPMSSLPNHENCRQPDSCSESVRVDRPAPMTDPSLSAASVSDDSSSAVTVRSSNTLLLSLPPPSSATAPVHEGFRAAVSSADESSSQDDDVLRSSFPQKTTGTSTMSRSSFLAILSSTLSPFLPVREEVACHAGGTTVAVMPTLLLSPTVRRS